MIYFLYAILLQFTELFQDPKTHKEPKYLLLVALKLKFYLFVSISGIN